jgi:hypothetical protein
MAMLSFTLVICLPRDAQVHTEILIAEPPLSLLQLPGPALDLILQHLDQRSLASVVSTYIQLSDGVLFAANISSVVLHKGPRAKLRSFIRWLERQSGSLSHLEHCSSVGTQHKFVHGADALCQLPCPQLRQLYLEGLWVQLEPGNGYPGVLRNCSGLTALQLHECILEDLNAAIEAITALPQLESLSVCSYRRDIGSLLAAKLLCAATQLSSKLTHLSLADVNHKDFPEHPGCQLSAPTHLQHLRLPSYHGLQGGLPSQLVKLTALEIETVGASVDNGSLGQLQHLSCFTALRALQYQSGAHYRHSCADALPGIEQLSQLTSLELQGLNLHSVGDSFPPRKVQWDKLSALQRLALSSCTVAADDFAAFTQLRVLSLTDVDVMGDTPAQSLLLAVAQLPLLTVRLSFTQTQAQAELRWSLRDLNELEVEMALYEAEEALSYGRPVPTPFPATAFTALTASTNMCSLQLSLDSKYFPTSPILFAPGTEYPHLRHIYLQYSDIQLPHE